jgi:hypothetical protein
MLWLDFPAENSSAGQEIAHVLVNRKVDYHVHKTLLLELIASQTTSVFKIHVSFRTFELRNVAITCIQDIEVPAQYFFTVSVIQWN